MVQKRWEVVEENRGLAVEIAEALNLSRITAQILLNRGVSSVEEAKRFFDVNLNNLFDPFLFSAMSKAIDRLMYAIETKERMVIFGDYDVDGITGTSLLWRVLKHAGANVDYYIPDRSEGYGLNLAAVERLSQGGYTLILTVDNGISCFREVELANSLGTDVIITDHHEPPEVIPEAFAVINPKCTDSGYPFPYLAGVGVGFKLCQALALRQKSEELAQYALQQLDLVTLGTIADIVPLVGENRIIAANGLKLMKDTENVGIKALIKVAEMEGKELNAGHIGFILGPRINAIGRMDNPGLGVELLTTDDARYAEELAEKLDQANRKRQMLEETIVKSAIEAIEATQMNEECGIVLASEEWHHGIIGIAASKLVERYYRPTILIAIHDGVGKGSARGIRGLNLFEALTHCKEYLLGFGGHEMAAGLSIDPVQIEPFCKAFQEYCARVLSPEDLLPYLKIDAAVRVEELNFNLLGELEKLEPHGPGNSRPILKVGKVEHQYNLVGATGDHLRLQIFSSGSKIGGIGFGMAAKVNDFKDSPFVDVAFSLDRNLWQGREYLQMMLSDVKSAEETFIERLVHRAESYLGVYQEELVQHRLTKVAVDLRQRLEAARDSEFDGFLAEHFLKRAGTFELYTRLHRGESLLSVSCTGEVSLDAVQCYAAYLALRKCKASCLIYPQRALLDGDYRRLKEKLAGLGLRVYRAIASLSYNEEIELQQALEKGEFDLLFTTPAYLTAYLEKFKLLKTRIGFWGVAEAQQLHENFYSFTLGYDGLTQLWMELGEPQLLAYASTLDDLMADRLVQEYRLAQILVEGRTQSNLELSDQREKRDKAQYLRSLLVKGEKTLILVNSPEESVRVAKSLQELVKERPASVLYYHQMLPPTEQKQVEELFLSGDITTLVTTSFGKGMEISDIRHVVCYHLIFHYGEFLQVCRLAGRDGKKAFIHLLYSLEDRKANEVILDCIAPERDFLVRVYVLLGQLAQVTPEISISEQALALKLSSPASGVHPLAVENSLAILRELQLIAVRKKGAERVIRVLPKPKQKLDLSSSMRYNEGIMDKKFFGAFCQVALQEKSAELLERICFAEFPMRYMVKEVESR